MLLIPQLNLVWTPNLQRRGFYVCLFVCFKSSSVPLKDPLLHGLSYAEKEGMFSVNSASEANFINIKKRKEMQMNGSNSENAGARKRNRVRGNAWEDNLKSV